MKSDIHPNWNDNCTVTCSCGNTFETGSTLKIIKADICNNCHPFYTGEMKFVDVQGRVEKFQAKQKAAKNYQKTTKSKTQQKQQKKQEASRSLKEVLSEYKKEVGKSNN